MFLRFINIFKVDKKINKVMMSDRKRRLIYLTQQGDKMVPVFVLFCLMLARCKIAASGGECPSVLCVVQFLHGLLYMAKEEARLWRSGWPALC